MFYLLYFRGVVLCCVVQSCSILRQATLHVLHSLILTFEQRSYGATESATKNVSLDFSLFIDTMLTNAATVTTWMPAKSLMT